MCPTLYRFKRVPQNGVCRAETPFCMNVLNAQSTAVGCQATNAARTNHKGLHYAILLGIAYHTAMLLQHEESKAF